ncbi:transcriptional activator protein DAL81 [Xylogone sp. PMI_703]|nr:transcriptional activator protein DAL81 [Xylogone sp. PMI_703]
MATAQPRAQKERPCDACRRRKIRCIRVLADPDLCALCQSRSESCTFVQDPPRKRKRQLTQENGNSNLVGANARSPPSGIQSVSPGQDNDLPPTSFLRETLGHKIARSIDYIGPTTEYDASLLQLLRFDQGDESVNGTGAIIRRVNRNTHVAVRLNTQEESDSNIKYLDTIEGIVSPHGQALIDIYFRIVHPSYPILHKKVFLEKYGRNYHELTPTCLAAVYILALNWWSYSPNLVRLKKPNVQELEELFPKLLTDIYRRPKPSDLQAGLIFCQRPDGSSWVMMGELMAMSQSVGLHIDSSDWRIPEWERALRKRLAWAVFIQDKWGALIHGRPATIVRDNWDVRPVGKSDFPETAKDDDDEEGSSEVEKGMIIFMNLITLTEILSDILDTFFTLKALKEKVPPAEVLERAKPLQIRLRAWYTQLPPELVIEETKPRKLSSTGHLHLAYFCAEVTLHRAILRSLDTPNTDPQLRSITRAAARVRFTSAVEFIKRLKPEHLQSFWFFASKINLAIIGTFGCMLWATSTSKEERDIYRQQLAEFRWTLRLSSTAAEFMKFTVAMLDDSPVFASEPSTKQPQKQPGMDVSDRQSSGNHSPEVNEELGGASQGGASGTGSTGGQFTPQDTASSTDAGTGASGGSFATNFDYDGLNTNEYWLEYSAFAFGGVPGAHHQHHGDNLTASITPPEFYNAG